MAHLGPKSGAAVSIGGLVPRNALLTWRVDTFGYAEGYDEASARYHGLQHGQRTTRVHLNIQLHAGDIRLHEEIGAVSRDEACCSTVN
jgi:hypothetical protein